MSILRFEEAPRPRFSGGTVDRRRLPGARCSTLLVALPLVAMLAGCEQPAPPPAEPVAQDDASYLMGYRMGLALNEQAFDANFDSLLDGVKDGASQQDPKLTDAQMQAAAEDFDRRREAGLKVRADSKLAEVGTFFATNGSRDGVTSTESGLQYEVITAGTGAAVTASDRVKVHYDGTLLDGSTFDSSRQRDEPAVFGVTQVIRGWQEALVLMKVGDRWKLYIPPELGYGARGAGANIPPHSALVFDVEVLGIEE